MAEASEALLAQAVAELGIDVPVLRAEESGAGLKLWLYGQGDRPVVWKPKAKAKPGAKKTGE
jgi:hypothetical protein